MSLGFLTKSITNRPVQSQKKARSTKNGNFEILDLGKRGFVLSV